ncbi:unnamed protein product [Triticum turgidum subsp. durum]|uniref:Uncharacterized protein n=1 Tax=Triticum turgidum subsp. durum TaxID=4567 RepID=A0A9R1A5V7_TRITD|nr:unnamed protein product [Triticum turgidum subsp. durum]
MIDPTVSASAHSPSLTLTPAQILTLPPPAPVRDPLLDMVFQAASDDNLPRFKGTLPPPPSRIPTLTQFRCLTANILEAQSIAALVMMLDTGRGRPKEAIEELRVEDDAKLQGFSALHIAASRCSLEVCRYLVEELLIDVDLVDKEGPSIFKTLIY